MQAGQRHLRIGRPRIAVEDFIERRNRGIGLPAGHLDAAEDKVRLGRILVMLDRRSSRCLCFLQLAVCEKRGCTRK